MEQKEKEEKPEEQLKEDELDFPESLLEYQIETKESAITQVLFHLKQMEEKNKEYHEKNDLMQKQQEARIKSILRHIKEEEKKQHEKKVVTRDHVEELLKEMCQYAKDNEQLLEDLHSQIEDTDQELSVKQSERDSLLEYKNVGSKIHLESIMNLEKDIKEVKEELQRAKEHYSNDLKTLKEEHGRQIERHTELSKKQAAENAVRYLDKYNRREIEENKWLKEVVKMYQKKVNDLKASVQLLEEENIGLVTKLIDGRLQNLRVPRHLFLTQAAGSQDEFPTDETKEAEYKEYAVKADGDESLRSADVPCQKNRAFAKIQSKPENEKPQDGDEKPQEKSLTPTLDSLWYADEKDFQEYLKLDPLETQLLCLIGKAMPVHEEPEELSSTSRREDGIISKSDGHITAQMIKALDKQKFG
ncbi:coiled-coil domain-containing protein 83 [Phaenicophaeus curvirostris]|uniref:coiled-coil domain-containing protein 83 n=1 Tax=Phaenicophaeus curvirostris TaxID=33595 RepID=UPI0037F0A7B6